MPRQLHIVVSPPDEFAQDLLRAVTDQAGGEVEVIDWVSQEPDYAIAVAKIFAAESIATW